MSKKVEDLLKQIELVTTDPKIVADLRKLHAVVKETNKRQKEREKKSAKLYSQLKREYDEATAVSDALDNMLAKSLSRM